jgi:phage shock protein PspC (stress-responsive transcriptional regulator)
MPREEERTDFRRPAMRGRVLDFSVAENSGVISADDGNRYRFAGPDWKSQGRQPIPGSSVDFVADGDRATEVYIDTPAAGSPSAPTAEWPAGLDVRYRGLYRSSDEGRVMGLCAGIAHKYGWQVGVVRFLMVVLTIWLVFTPYLLAFFVPSLPTKGISRPV